MKVSISVTLDSQLVADLSAAAVGGEPSAVVADALREYLDRRTAAATHDWHTSLGRTDAAAFDDFNAAW
jgi:predicted transcriptional regulator